MGKFKKGFTLIELIVVILVLGILVSIGVFKYYDLTQGANEVVFEANHRVLLEAGLAYKAAHKGLVPNTLADLNPYVDSASTIDKPEQATYVVAGGIITSSYTLHREAAKQTLVFDLTQ